MFRSLLKEKSIWENLRNEVRPIFLYGTGNGADKILDVCNEYSIKISGVFASSGFVRNRTYRDMPVRSIEDIRREFGNDIVVLLAFGTTLPSVIENINDIANKHTLYIPEVPLYDKELFNREFLWNNIDKIYQVYELLKDEESKNVFADLIKFRYTGLGKYLSRVQSMEDMYSSLLNKETIDKVLDCGAFKGDSAKEIINALEPSEVVCFEPDPKTFNKLQEYAKSEDRCRIIPMNFASGKECKEVEFSTSGSRGSGFEGKNRRAKTSTIKIITIDSLKRDDFDLIKLDVEGDEDETISGALETISNSHPALSISIYHKTSDLIEIPLRIKEIFPDYNFYIRRVPCIPAWDISLLAVPEDKEKKPFN